MFVFMNALRVMKANFFPRPAKSGTQHLIWFNLYRASSGMSCTIVCYIFWEVLA